MQYRYDPSRRLFVLGAAATAAAVATTAPRLSWAADLEKFDKAGIKRQAAAMLEKHGVEPDKASEIKGKVDKVLKRRWSELDSEGVMGVGAFRMGGGGLLIKVTKGDGVMSFADDKTVNYTMKSTGIGANIGGAGMWGVMLLVGLKVKKGFGGSYKGSDKGATFAEESTALNVMSHRGEQAHAHDVYFISSSSGALATAGASKFTIAVRW